MLDHRFGEDGYTLESDDDYAEEAAPTMDLEATVASLHTLATLVIALQAQAGVQGYKRQQEESGPILGRRGRQSGPARKATGRVGI